MAHSYSTTPGTDSGSSSLNKRKHGTKGGRSSSSSLPKHLLGLRRHDAHGVNDNKSNNNNNNNHHRSPASLHNTAVVIPLTKGLFLGRTPVDAQKRAQTAPLGLDPALDGDCHALSRKHLQVVWSTPSEVTLRLLPSENAAMVAVKVSRRRRRRHRRRFPRLTEGDVNGNSDGDDDDDDDDDSPDPATHDNDDDDDDDGDDDEAIHTKGPGTEFVLHEGDLLMLRNQRHVFQVVRVDHDVDVGSNGHRSGATPENLETTTTTTSTTTTPTQCDASSASSSKKSRRSYSSTNTDFDRTMILSSPFSKGDGDDDKDGKGDDLDILHVPPSHEPIVAGWDDAWNHNVNQSEVDYDSVPQDMMVDDRTKVAKPPLISFSNLPVSLEQLYGQTLRESDAPWTGHACLIQQLYTQRKLPAEGSKLCQQMVDVLTWGCSRGSDADGLGKNKNRKDVASVKMTQFFADSHNHKLDRFYWDGTRQHLVLDYFQCLLREAPELIIPRLLDVTTGGYQWWKIVLEEVIGAVIKTNFFGHYKNGSTPDPVQVNVGARAMVQLLQLQACAVAALHTMLEASWKLERAETEKAEAAAKVARHKSKAKKSDGHNSDDSMSSDEEFGVDTAKDYEPAVPLAFALLRDMREFGSGRGAASLVAQAIAKVMVTQRSWLTVFNPNSSSARNSTSRSKTEAAGASKAVESTPKFKIANGKGSSQDPYIGRPFAAEWIMTNVEDPNDVWIQIYYGKVTRKIGKKYHVVFDDGDEHDYNVKELTNGMNLYEKDQEKKSEENEDEVPRNDTEKGAATGLNEPVPSHLITPQVQQTLMDAVENLSMRLAELLATVWNVVGDEQTECGKHKRGKKGGRLRINVSNRLQSQDLAGILWNAMDLQLQEKQADVVPEFEEELRESLLRRWIWMLQKTMGKDFAKTLVQKVGIPDDLCCI